ncbi:MAG: phenylalanine--tRNA ligase subunit alpha [Actinomycetota bacterium]
MSVSEQRAQLEELRAQTIMTLEKADTAEEVRQLRSDALGRKSELSGINNKLGSLEPEGRKELGQVINSVRGDIETAIEARLISLEAKERSVRVESETIDVTLPGRAPARGRIHPITQVIDEILDAFIGIGFRVVEGPVVETDHYNFEALNIPTDHSARSMYDSFYIKSDSLEMPLIRAHTSPMQARIMEAQDPPVYVVVPGRCGRRDEPTPNHLSGFTQIEGLAVDEGLSFADMKGTLEVFAKAMFGPHQRVRMHPSYFPFTEPSAEVYVSCFTCEGIGCPTCRGEGWIEIMGAGMVHPKVLRGVGYDPERYTGFAFGMGVERIAKLRYAVHDVRTFYENDLRFLAEF